jgi:hypothetical protein
MMLLGLLGVSIFHTGSAVADAFFLSTIASGWRIFIALIVKLLPHGDAFCSVNSTLFP